MAIVYAQDIIEVAILATYAGRPVATVVHLFNDEVGGSDASKVEDLRDNWQDHVMQNLNNGYALSSFEWRSLDPSDNNVGSVPPNPAKPLVGGSSGSGCPPNVAFLVHKTTSDRPRGKRDGRMFLPGVVEGDVGSDGAVPAGVITAFNADLDAFWNGITDSPGNLRDGSGMAVLETTPLSREKGTHEVTLEWRKVTSLTLDPLVSTQRDRLR